MRRSPAMALAAFTVLAGACAGTLSQSTVAPSASPPITVADTTTTLEDTTTTTLFTRLVDISATPPLAEELNLTTDDGIDLYARWWPGNRIGLLVGHDFDSRSPGALGQRPAQSSENQLWVLGALAREGFSVLAPDLRGHGRSSGEYDARRSPLDLEAGYDFLRSQDVSVVIMIGWVGTGTAAVVLDAEDDVSFDGMMLLFTPPQDTGLDAQRVIGELDIPIGFIAVNTGPSVRFAKLLEQRTRNSRGLFVFERVPTGLAFSDIYGPEFVGRIAGFADAVAAEG